MIIELLQVEQFLLENIIISILHQIEKRLLSGGYLPVLPDGMVINFIKLLNERKLIDFK
jgi:hypothetical protein